MAPIQRLLCWLIAAWVATSALTSTRAEDTGTESEVAPAQGALLEELQRQAAQPLPPNAEPQSICAAHHRRGVALSRMGKTLEAIEEFKLALSINQPHWKAREEWCSRWRLQTEIAAAYRHAGDPRGRIEFLKSIGDELRKDNVRRYFFTLIWLMDDYVTLGQLRSAESALRQAGDLLPEIRQRKDWETEEHSVLNQWHVYGAYMQEMRGNFAEAERLRRESLRHARAYLEVRTRIHGTSHPILRHARNNVAQGLRLLGNTLSAQGRFSEAEVLVRESLSMLMAQISQNSPEGARILGNLGNIKMQQGRLAEAESLIRQSLSALDASQIRPASPLLADRRADLAFVLMMQERWPEALNLFELRDQGLRADATQFARTGSLRTDWVLTLIRNGKTAQATEMAQRIVNYYRKVPYADPQVVARATGIFALALAANGEDARALPLFETAIPQLQSQESGDSEGDGLGAGRQFRVTAILEGYLALLARLHQRNEKVGGRDPVGEAFAIADVARGSAVQRAVAASSARISLPDASLAELARKEQDAGNRRQSLSKLLARLSSAPEGQRLDSVMTEVRREMESLGEQQASLRKTLAARFPDYLRLIDPKPATLAEMQSALQPDEAMLAIYLGRDQAYVWTLNKQQQAFRTIPLTRATVDRHVERLRDSLSLEDGSQRIFASIDSHALYKALLAPDAPLWTGARVLNVITHASLGQIPFAVLLTAPLPTRAKLDQAPWLIHQLAIAQQSSASTFLALRQRQTSSGSLRDFLGFGDPTFAEQAPPANVSRVRHLRLLSVRGKEGEGIESAFTRLAPLPDTEQELREIASTLGADPARTLYLHRRASEKNVKTAPLGSARVIAFATHGLIPGDLRGLDQPALALANPRLAGDAQNDGLLTLDEVLGLRLNADWVVLSACNTGSPDGLQGEAVSGLGRGFFFAGARSLLVSNWAVETESARLLTTGIFRLQAASPSLTRAEALRQSMIEVMRMPRDGYEHPSIWGPFTLAGDGWR